MKWHKVPTETDITTAEFFFSNKRQVICPMTKCTLMKEDCKTPDTANKDIQVDDKWPFKVTSNQQSILGYKDRKVCLKCEVGEQKQSSQVFQLT